MISPQKTQKKDDRMEVKKTGTCVRLLGLIGFVDYVIEIADVLSGTHDTGTVSCTVPRTGGRVACCLHPRLVYKKSTSHQ